MINKYVKKILNEMFEEFNNDESKEKIYQGS